MKPLSLSLLLVGILIQSAFAQKKLSVSPTSSAFTYVYRLTDQEAYDLAAFPEKELKQEMLHNLVDSFSNALPERSIPQLPFGNYLFVKGVGNHVNYSLYPSQNVRLYFINDGKNIQFILSDTAGRWLDDAEVMQGRKRLRFDPKTRAYQARDVSAKKSSIISIRYDGVSNLFSYPKSENTNPIPRLQKHEKEQQKPYSGQLIFNKPKYRPGDTVRFKAFLLTEEGKPVPMIPLHAAVAADGKTPLTVAILKPYREGGYEGSFVLADSLRLQLDRHISLELKAERKGEWATVFSRSFFYEDYELSSAVFALRSDQNEQRPGSPITLYFKATDDNGLSMPDARVEVEVSSGYLRDLFADTVFIPSLLWKTSFNLDPTGETKLVLPDSIFPRASLGFRVDAKVRNSNNETRELNRHFSYSQQPKGQLLAQLGKDSVYFNFVLGKDTIPQHGVLYSFTRNGVIDSMELSLPARLKTDPRVYNYRIKTPDGEDFYSNYSGQFPQFEIEWKRSQDSLIAKVSSLQNLPFWYTIFSGENELSRGYSKRIDTTMRFSNPQPAELALSYYWGGEMKRLTKRAIYNTQMLLVDMDVPDAIYPGQSLEVGLKVTDIEHKPLGNVDLTAYAFTSKFDTDYGLYPLYFGDLFKPRKQKQAPYSFPAVERRGNIPLDWKQFGQKWGLDSIPYYQLVFPGALYIAEEPIAGDESVVVPFASLEGQIDPAYIIYIDKIPVYFNGADQLKRYAFRISPGAHQIELITANHRILAEYNFKEGRKTVMSIASDIHNSLAQVTPISSLEFVRLQQELSKYLIYMNENFEGNKAVISGAQQEWLINPPPDTEPKRMIRIGPVVEDNLRFQSGDVDLPFVRKPNQVYTFFRTGLKVRQLDSNEMWFPFSNPRPEAYAYDQDPLRKGEIDSIWNDYLDRRSRNGMYFDHHNASGPNSGVLRFELDTSISNAFSHQGNFLKNVVLYKNGDAGLEQAYGGNTRNFPGLVAGWYSILFLLKDNQYSLVKNITIKAGGINYFRLKDLKFLPADLRSITLDKKLKSAGFKKPGISDYNRQIPGLVLMNPISEKELVNRMSGVVIDDETSEPLPAASIFYVAPGKPPMPIGRTNMFGQFSIRLPKKGELLFAYVGYQAKRMKVRHHRNFIVSMTEQRGGLHEVVIRGYSRGSFDVQVSNVEQLLQGKVAGLNIQNNSGTPGLRGSVNIRGLSSIETTGDSDVSGKIDSKVRFIVDGKPYNGNFAQIDQNSIVSIEVLKDEVAVQMYGDFGANGIILIKTNGSGAWGNEAEGGINGQSLRRNFSDYAIWQPKLNTDAQGKASFKVTFSDDITSWNAGVFAINGNQQSGVLKKNIRSFKSLSASLVSPAFARYGDSIGMIGKLMNYNPNEEKALRKFRFNDVEVLNNEVSFKSSWLDTIGILARPFNGSDSLQFQYSLEQKNGYFDGELRKIPLLPLGVLETKGYFNVLNADTTAEYAFDPKFGPVTISAETSVFPVLLDEMEKLRNYEYLCNEQLASKLKSLLLEKKLKTYLQQDFDGEKSIKELISKLLANQGMSGAWGWWRGTADELWISNQVVEALLQAKQSGYEVDLNKTLLHHFLADRLTARQRPDDLFAARLMHTLDSTYRLNDWIDSLERHMKKAGPTLQVRLELMRLKQLCRLSIDLGPVLQLKKRTLLGSMYWGERKFDLWDNNIQNTLLVYQLLRTEGGHEAELRQIRNYFLEQRRDGQWRNTYESAQILETITPDLLSEGQKSKASTLVINNGEKVRDFPFTKTLAPQMVKINKSGDGPVYFSAYQQFTNSEPEKISKAFSVQTSFYQNGDQVRVLKAGLSATLKVEVDVTAEASYVMIEIPIPAGCSYENKRQTSWGVETHREYFKDKTSIFCTELPEGKHSFEVQLVPRYSGRYHLNPAKAEMMYFPVFYGREGMKAVSIR